VGGAGGLGGGGERHGAAGEGLERWGGDCEGPAHVLGRGGGERGKAREAGRRSGGEWQGIPSGGLQRRRGTEAYLPDDLLPIRDAPLIGRAA
jgi:hypothetical protein